MLMEKVTWKETDAFQQVLQLGQLKTPPSIRIFIPTPENPSKTQNHSLGNSASTWKMIHEGLTFPSRTGWEGQHDWGTSKTRPQSWERIKSWHLSDYSRKESSQERLHRQCGGIHTHMRNTTAERCITTCTEQGGFHLNIKDHWTPLGNIGCRKKGCLHGAVVSVLVRSLTAGFIRLPTDKT